MGIKNSSNFYKKVNEVFKHNTIYIHRHAHNIGKLIGGGGSAASVLKDNRRSSAAKQQYKKLFLANSSLSKDAIELLKTTGGYTEDQVWNAIDQSLKKSLSQIDMSKLAALHGIANDIPSVVSMISKQGYAKQAFQNQQKFLQCLADAADLLGSHGKGLALAILAEKSQQKGAVTLKGLGSKIENAIRQFQKNSNGAFLSEADKKDISSVIGQLNNLARNLKTGETKAGKKLNDTSSWSSIFTNLFSLGFSEALGRQATASAFAASGNAIKIVGTSAHKGVKYSLYGEENFGKKIVGKTDFGGKNLNMSVSENSIIGSFGEIKINLGGSMKFYKGQPFQPLSNKSSKSLTIGSGSGGSLADALNAIYGGSFKALYYAYNALAHEQIHNLDLIHEALLSRHILRLFSTTGGASDFSQFLLINGEIVTVWDLVRYVSDITNNISKSASQKGNNQAISISIPGRKEIIAANTIDENSQQTQLIQAYNRSKNVNSAIHAARITAVLHVNRLAQLYKK